MATPDRQQQISSRAREFGAGVASLLAAMEATYRYVAAIREQAVAAQRPDMEQLLTERLRGLSRSLEALHSQAATIKRLEKVEIEPGSEAAALIYVDEMAQQFAIGFHKITCKVECDQYG